MTVTPEERKSARRKALLLLEHMDRTEKGLSDRLRQAGFSAEAAEDAEGLKAQMHELFPDVPIMLTHWYRAGCSSRSWCNRHFCPSAGQMKGVGMNGK